MRGLPGPIARQPDEEVGELLRHRKVEGVHVGSGVRRAARGVGGAEVDGDAAGGEVMNALVIQYFDYDGEAPAEADGGG